MFSCRCKGEIPHLHGGIAYLKFYPRCLAYMCRLWHEWRQWWVHSGEVIIIYRSLWPHFNWWIRVHINTFFKREYNFLFYFYIDFINKSKRMGTTKNTWKFLKWKYLFWGKWLRRNARFKFRRICCSTI
jgi:hypothetical protein